MNIAKGIARAASLVATAQVTYALMNHDLILVCFFSFGIAVCAIAGWWNKDEK